ncbi:MAG: glycosyl hydrolase [Gemmatimonadetes bacterium]|nr:glycosyl hydrolase [Gemmatimonadota bacterium]
MSYRPSRLAPLALLVPVLLVGLAGAPPPAAAQSPFSSLRWRSIGPVNTSGRIDDIAVAQVKGRAEAIYVATASGGLWKSRNNGVSWKPVFDHVNAMMSIGAVAVAPSAPLTVWVGTGEANTRQSSSWGDGVYRSTDGGETWTDTGLKDTRSIGRIVIDPTNPNIVYVAAQGHLWGPNAERGVFKTTDAGRTWKKVLFVDENTGANDIVIDPANPQVLYASTYQRQRRAWGFNGGGPGSGIYKTSDGGETWTKLGNGLPEGDKGRIALAIYASEPWIVYATVQAHGEGQGIYRTLDAGTTWKKVSSLDTRPNYFSQIRIDPQNRDHVYTLGSNRGFYISNDGGKTWIDRFSDVHGEDHALWIDPDEPSHMIVGGDGGVSITWDRGRTWDFRRNMPIGQFYEVDVDNSVPFRICGGLQDNGIWCMPSAVRDRNGIADRDAWNIGGGDGFHAIFDPTDSDMVLQEAQNGNAAWVNIETMERRGARPGTGERPVPGEVAAGPGGFGGSGGRYRWNWDTPIIVSQRDPDVWYMGAQVLFKSTDKGSSWTKISPDLTLDLDRDTLKMMGAVVGPDALSRNDGQSSYGTLTSISESPLDGNVIYTGSDDGQVQLTRDGGKTWKNITSRVPGVPPRTYVSTVLASRFVAGRVYVTFDGHYSDDYEPYVFVSDDYGEHWRSLAAGLPETSVNRIAEDPRDANVLVLAHERGIHVSNDGGATWYRLTTNMPTVPVDDVVFQKRDGALVAGTHGRGIWVLDDIGPIEALTAKALKSDATLLPLHPAREMSTFTPQAWYGAGEHFSPNPDWDARIAYWLKDGATGSAEITVTDSAGRTVRTLQGPLARGLNRVDWDLRYAPPVDSANVPARRSRGFGGPPVAKQVGYPAGRGGFGRGGPPEGPLVMPGTYTVRVTIPGQTPLTGSVVVQADPLPKVTAADRAARQVLLMKIYDWTKTLGLARLAVAGLASQDDTLKADLGARGDSIVARVARLRTEVDRAFNGVNGQRAPIEAWSGLPSVDQRKALDNALEAAAKAVAALDGLVTTDIPAAYRTAGKSWTHPVKAVAAGGSRGGAGAPPEPGGHRLPGAPAASPGRGM